MVRLAAAVALALAGCGDVADRIEWFQPSERMAIRAWVSDAGYRYAFGWRDRELDVTCDAAALACAPPVAAYFADASCRDLVVATAGPLPPIASYVDGFSGAGHGVQLGEPFVGPVYAGWRGCVLAGETDPDLSYAHALGFTGVLVPDRNERDGGVRTMYPDLAFVALAEPAAIEVAARTGQLHVEDGGDDDRLRTRYLLDDVMPFAAGIFDVALDAPCTPGLDRAGVLRCLPRFDVPLYREPFDDAGCTHPVGAPLYRDRGFAEVDAGYVRIDVPATAPAFVRAGTLCLPASDHALWRAGAALDPTELVALTIEELAP